MKITKKILAILLLLFVQLCVYGQQISRQEAINAAVNTLNYQIGKQQLSEKNVDTVFATTSQGNTLLYEVHSSSCRMRRAASPGSLSLTCWAR